MSSRLLFSVVVAAIVLILVLAYMFRPPKPVKPAARDEAPTTPAH